MSGDTGILTVGSVSWRSCEYGGYSHLGILLTAFGGPTALIVSSVVLPFSAPHTLSFEKLATYLYTGVLDWPCMFCRQFCFRLLSVILSQYVMSLVRDAILE